MFIFHVQESGYENLPNNLTVITATVNVLLLVFIGDYDLKVMRQEFYINRQKMVCLLDMVALPSFHLFCDFKELAVEVYKLGCGIECLKSMCFRWYNGLVLRSCMLYFL